MATKEEYLKAVDILVEKSRQLAVDVRNSKEADRDLVLNIDNITTFLELSGAEFGTVADEKEKKIVLLKFELVKSVLCDVSDRI